MIIESYDDNNDLAHKMLFIHTALLDQRGTRMRGFLINKNLCLYYWLKKKIGKKWALAAANGIEKTILIFGREIIPYFNNNGRLTEEKE